jgi:arylsulfatase
MQAPENELQKYKGRYDAGYESIRAQRFAKMKKLGVVANNIQLSPPDSAAVTPSWANEKNKPAMARRMETYAAMIDVMDQGIGKIINELKKEGLYDNTIIIFLQDNGGCHEMVGAGATGTVAKNKSDSLMRLTKESIEYSQNPPVTRDGRLVRQGKEIMAGPADTYISYMRQWANVSNTPYRMYKHWVYEGGISTPLIIHWPNGIKHDGEIRKQPGHEIDIMPTIVELAHAKYPAKFNGHTITAEAGVSLVPTFSNEALKPRAIYWEHEMNKAVQMGKWKIVCQSEMLDGKGGAWKHYHSEPWELYNIEQDRSELHNLADKYPDVVAKMAKMWEVWAHKAKVLPAPWTEIK